ncbi:hypothetical protein ACOZ4N_01245 (plasmid) [Halorientalis pallida]|uniref:hypothetical protein n=1 Tax=Halorientalis pallida TaxID=2479928 RepID=UPI003C6F914C
MSDFDEYPDDPENRQSQDRDSPAGPTWDLTGGDHEAYFDTIDGLPHQTDDPEIDVESRQAVRYGESRQERTELERVIDRVVFALVPAKSRFEAIAKGAVAFDRATVIGDVHQGYRPSEHGPLVELVSDYEPESRAAFASDWGDLPDATPLVSTRGSQLFTIARSKTDWNESINQISQDRELPAESTVYLYDEGGAEISRWSQLVCLLEGTPVPEEIQDQETPLPLGTAEPALWVVPAFSFRVKERALPAGRELVGNNRRRVFCEQCETETVHKRDGVERIADTTEELQDHPAGTVTDEFVGEDVWEIEIWRCSRCDTGRSV